MNLVYTISRWTSEFRGVVRHIDNGNGKPLCGGNGKKNFTWQPEVGEPTCKRCQDIFSKKEKKK